MSPRRSGMSSRRRISRFLSAIGHQIATAIERTQLAEQATRVALVEERNRLAREVHDTLAQELTGIALQLEAADALLEHSPDRARARIRQALERTRESLDEARRSVLDLRAGPLERQALPAALETLGQRFTAETGTPVASSSRWWGRGCRRAWKRRSTGSPRRRWSTSAGTPRPARYGSSCARRATASS